MINIQEEGEDNERYLEMVRQLEPVAKSMIANSSYCVRILECEHVPGFGYFEAFKITFEPSDGSDGRVWVFVGAYPYAVLEWTEFTTPVSALEGYISAMEDWVHVRREGGDTSECIYVRGNPSFSSPPDSLVFVEELASRLRFLRENLLPEWRERFGDEASGEQG